MLGRGWMDGINAAARQGGTGGVKRYLGGYVDGGTISLAGGGFIERTTNRLVDLASMAREGIQSALSSVGKFVLGGLRKAAEVALRPVRNSLSSIGGGRLGEVAGGLAKRAIKGLLGFADKKDQAALVLEGDPFSRDRSGWPRAVMGRVAANTRAAVNFVREMFGMNNIGTLGNRKNRSDHPFGKALDVMIPNYRSPSGIAKGNQIAKWFVDNPDAFGTKYVIWRDRINSGSGWRPYAHPSGVYNDTTQHRNHPHISLFDQGGRLQPGITQVMNATGQSELVLNPDQEGALAQALRERRAVVAASGVSINGPINIHCDDAHDLVRQVESLGQRARAGVGGGRR